MTEYRAASPAKGGPAGGGSRGGRGGTRAASQRLEYYAVTLDADVLSMSVNGGRGLTAATDDRMMGFGPIALYAGGAGESQFKDIAYKDLNLKFEPAENVSPHFKMRRNQRLLLRMVRRRCRHQSR